MIKTIASYTELNNSVHGNPRYDVQFTDGTSAITSSDCPASYEIRNNVGKTVRLDLTRAGRIIKTHVVEVL